MSNRTNARTRTAGTPTRLTIPTGAPTAVGRDRRARMARSPAPAGRYARKYILAIATFVALAVPAAASANLTAVGPVDPASVPFPTFYDDGVGTSLALCVNDPLCPAGPSVFTNEAPNDEAFYMAASAELSGPDGQSVSLEFAIEAAWLDPETPITFGRIQATLDELEPSSTYTVEHRWGESRFKTDANGTLRGGARAASAKRPTARSPTRSPRRSVRSFGQCRRRPDISATASRPRPSRAARFATACASPGRACPRP
jgi:hypothetical protein